MFAVQNGGWCAASATADQTFDKQGTSAACGSDGEGGPWANEVYVIKGKMSKKYLLNAQKNTMKCFIVDKRPNELEQRNNVYLLFYLHGRVGSDGL